MNLEKRTAEVLFFGTEQKAKCKMTSCCKDYGLNRVSRCVTRHMCASLNLYQSLSGR